MGFIEDLRQKRIRDKKAFEEDQRKKRDLEAKERTRNEQIRQKQVEEENRQYNESVKNMEASDFPRLTDELASSVSGMRKTKPFKFTEKKSVRGKSELESAGVVFSLIWDEGVAYAKERPLFLSARQKSIGIKFYPNGNIMVEGNKWRGSSRLSYQDWYQKPDNIEKSLEKAFYNPRIDTWTYDPNPRTYGEGGGPCLPGNSPISTPNGSVLIKNLKVGDYVWTVDRFGQRVQTVVVKKVKRIVSKNHKVANIILKDGRELVVSHGHPTVDYRQMGSLVKGDDLDMSTVASIKVISYKGKYTYDILPYGDTGGYWANNILIGSTLSSQFERTLLDSLYKPLYLSL